jgi:hypothetical protein
MNTLRALIAGGGASILASGIVLLGIAPAVESAFAPQPAPTVIETPGSTASPVPGVTATAEPEPEILGCEELLAIDSRPQVYDSPRVGQTVEEADASFVGATAMHSLTVAPEVNVSEYFSRLGCAPEGSRWAVVTLSDDYDLDVTDGRNGASYESTLDLESSTFTLTSLTGKSYQPSETFVTGPSGMSAVVFEIPETVEEGLFSATLTFTSTLDLYYGEAELPASATYAHEIAPTPFLLVEKRGCAPLGQEWC